MRARAKRGRVKAPPDDGRAKRARAHDGGHSRRVKAPPDDGRAKRARAHDGGRSKKPWPYMRARAKRGRVKALPDDGRAKGVSKQRAKQNYVAIHARARSKRGRVKAPPIEKRGHERGQTQRRAEQKQWRNMRAPKEDRTDQSDT